MPSWKQVVGTCIAFIGLMVAGVGIALAMVEVPNAQDAAKTQKNVYYWANGDQMVVAGGGDKNRQIVDLADIPEDMRNAVIAAENATFEDDAGVDPMGIARAVFNMAKGGETQSGSTITQQYVKNTYLNQDQTLKRKATELLISIKVGATEEKDTIIAGYLNTAYYGRGAYGIEAAARAYYDKKAIDLTTSECAFLSSTLNGPNLYDPAGGEGAAATKAKNTKRAELRWEWTLKRMVETGKLDAAKRDEIVAKDFPMPRPPAPATNKAGQIGYLTDLADRYIVANTDITKSKLDKGGYEIHTTFEEKKVNALAKSVKKVTDANIDPKKRPKTDKFVQFGGASVEPGTGKIKAIYGGADFVKHFTNNADYTGVQVGSTFKPFVLAAAMQHGVRDPKLDAEQDDGDRTKVSPKSIYDGDNKLKVKNYDGTVWRNEKDEEWLQTNDGNESKGDISLREAMQWSTNTPYIQLGMDVGTDKVKEVAEDAGIKEDSFADWHSPSFSLGTSAPSAIRLAGAYGTFAASGKQADPYSVESIETKDGVKWKHDAETTQPIPADVADNVTDVLRTVVQKGTGTKALAVDAQWPTAGKTGTTDGNKSAWFVGYTKQLSTAIGMFRADDRAEKQKFLKMYGTGGQKSIHGASFPAEIWTDYMLSAMKNEKSEDFPKAPDIGDIIGEAPSPTPTADPTDDGEPTTPASPTPDPSQPTGEPSPGTSCEPWDMACQANGGTSDGGTDAGTTDGGATGGTSPTPTAPSGGNGNGSGGNGNGGWFGGTDG
ncbi:transglycosylase domain-containing protein [Streptomyces sp. NBC_01304]|uniref:transglycosylase domain-containing protein n=1 Tax=Streptomyces sp. NBC_01304 TaxID=2903818 RepID=UPI002E12D49B|nr:penicillin-binding protein [Streptomyces sp. NBC_01304]